MTLYFAVRTDVVAGFGSPRVFGAFDTREAAQREIDNLKLHIVGVFAVYEGTQSEGVENAG